MIALADGWVETMLLCEHCDVGFYSLWELDGGRPRLDFHLEYNSRTEPGNFRSFTEDFEHKRESTMSLVAM